ncbi:hydroxyacylglutathione hydrolase [Otariodibacter oris]|uniref:Hydroxyacylglutathione hydrolase n=1 Tax=Otariodibacter oris TaxID=1032623 RepID=A0A420XHV8_9PAST|nr:hydroxyacylglutathione hydrolase [Otariodibacter oris]QGM80903.1 hydroxyacylglutathione hydrolase [Otariodibacter oris]RKR76922.1 hydroxyacylglutathione hydrolase [Otariodibacter oris]
MIKITPIPVLSDNYIWIIQKEKNVIVVDPSQSQPVLDFLVKNKMDLTAILLTHYHNDHTDGVVGLLSQYPNIPVYGSNEVRDLATYVVKAKEHISLLELDIEVIQSAGHTEEHISYLIDRQYLFCGDALFSGGCGRVFTGDYQAQFDTLQRFKQLPDFVEVYPAHEYTQSNLKFAEKVMKPSCALMEYQEKVDILRSQHKPTLPTTIGLEKQVNPFLYADSLEQFIQWRKGKDNL